jgi:hypothetical protein
MQRVESHQKDLVNTFLRISVCKKIDHVTPILDLGKTQKYRGEKSKTSRIHLLYHSQNLQQQQFPCEEYREKYLNSHTFQ